MAELTAPFVFKNDEKRIVYGPVLIPDEPDTDDDVVTAEQIETVAHNFVEEYGNIDLMHSLNNVGKMIESYILPMDLELENDVIVPKGSWMLGVRVTNDDSWQAVKDGKLSGFSIMAIERMAMKSADNTTEKNQSQKRTTLADLEDGWIVNAVSLVDEPAVPKAKFIAIKSKAKKKGEEITEETVQKAINGSIEHRKQLVRSKVYQTFDSDRTDSYVHSTLDDSVIIRIDDYVTNQSKMYQLGYSIDEQGNVEFTSEPEEVRIEETVVTVQGNQGISTNSKEESETDTSKKEKEEEGVFSKLFKKLGLRSSEKAGRTISDANFNKLKAAKEVIDELLAVGERERSNKSQKGAEEMEKEQVQEMINESVEPINSKLDDVLKSLKAEAKGEGSNEEETETSNKEKDGQENKGDNQEKDESTKDDNSTKNKDDNEQEDYKEKYEQAIKQLEKRPFSHRLAGQDNDGAEKSKDDDEETEERNAFGFKRKA
jgi:hypothetical protein